MPANTSFRIQCPSCEAMIPIRDSNLVGKKIDCPKCKYRFVVEDPAEADEAPVSRKGDKRAKRRDDADVPRGKKKSGSNNVLILGLALGVMALAVLSVGGYYMFLKDDGGTSGKASGVPVVSTGNPTTTPTNPNPDNPPDNTNSAAATAANPTPDQPKANLPTGVAVLDPGLQTPVADISSLLPNDTMSVISINMDRLRNCTLGQQSFDSPIGFRPETFKANFGLGIEEITKLIRAEEPSNQTFTVLRANRPVMLAEFQIPLGLKKDPKSPINGRHFFDIAPNPLIDNLSTILQAELESRDSQAKAKKKDTDNPLTLALLDPNTIVIANRYAMEEFLRANAQPELKSQAAGSPGAPAPSAPSPRDRGAGKSDRSDSAGGGAAGGAPDPSAGPQFAEKGGFLTIDPQLKAMIDRLEGDGNNIILSMVQKVQTDPNLVNRVRGLTGLTAFDTRGMKILGVALHQLNAEKFKGEVGLEMFREASAKELEDQIKQALPPAASILGLYLGGLKIDVEGAGAGGGSAGGGGIRGGGRGEGSGGGGAMAPPPPGAGGPEGGPSSPGAPSSGDGPKSTMKIERKGHTLLFNVDLSLNERAYDRIHGLSEGAVIRMKGMVDMATSESRWHELVDAAARYRDAKVEKEKKAANTFPRGTFPRDESVGRLSRTWPPSQRVSWMAGLLPFMGYQGVYEGINLHKSWRDESNLKQGAVLIPAFLNPRYPRPTWRAHPPSIGIRDVGATHYVGMAGVGDDAADYTTGDVTATKKLGIFGYDRRTALKDVKDNDGLANTIYVIQVPPNHERPWIAGGGATVMGAPDNDKAIAPFVATQANGKRGTYALMADGSVRFIAEDVSNDVFKALCTYKGGESISDINAVAPKVDPPKGTTLKTTAKAGSSGN